MGDKLSRKVRRNVLFLFGLLFLAYCFAVFDLHFHGPDEPVYYAYTVSLAEDGDLNIVDQVSPYFDQFMVSPSYNLPDPHNHGGVILWLPFYLYGKLFYFVQKAFDSSERPVLSPELFTKTSLSFSTLLFGILMLFFSYLICRKYSNPRDALWSIGLILFGTPLFYYLLFEPGNANIAASLFAVLLILILSWGEDFKREHWFLYGLLFSIAVAVKSELWLQLVFILPFFLFLLAIKKANLQDGIYFIFGLLVVIFLRGVNAYLKYDSLHLEEVLYLDSFFRYKSTYSFNGLLSPYRGILFTSPVLVWSLLGFISLTREIFRKRKNIFLNQQRNEILLFLLGLYLLLKLILIGRIFSPAGIELSLRVLIAEIPIFITLLAFFLQRMKKLVRYGVVLLSLFFIFWNLLIISEYVTGREWLYVKNPPSLSTRLSYFSDISLFLFNFNNFLIKLKVSFPLLIILFLIFLAGKKLLKIGRVMLFGHFTVYSTLAYFLITAGNLLNNQPNVKELARKGFFKNAEVIDSSWRKMDSREEELHLLNLFDLMRYYAWKGRLKELQEVKEKRQGIFRDKEPLYTHFYKPARPYLKLAQMLIENKKYDKALQCYQKALLLDPQDLDALLGLGDLYEFLGLYPQAANAYQRVIEINPGHINAIRRLAEILYKLGKVKEAIIFYQEYLKLNPGDANVLNTLGSIYLSERKFEQALNYLEEAIRLSPQFQDAYLNLGNLYREMGQYQKAVQIYQSALSLSSENPDPYLNIGSIYILQSKYTQALGYYQEALKLAPKQANIYQSLGDIYRELGEYESARRYYEEGLKVNNKAVDIYKNLADMETKSNRYEKAREYYQEAISLQPGYLDGYLGIGYAYWQEGRYEEALKYYQEALKLASWRWDIYQSLGDIYRELGEYESARRYYEEGLKRNERVVDIYMALAEIEAKSGRYEKALELYQEVVSFRPGYVDAYINIGHIYKGRGDYENAIGYFRKAVQIDFNNAQAHYHLGESYAILEKLENALKEVEHLEEIDNQFLAQALREFIKSKFNE